jgi:hypothetical protein
MCNMQAYNKHTYLITIPFTRLVQHTSSPDKKHTNTYHMDYILLDHTWNVQMFVHILRITLRKTLTQAHIFILHQFWSQQIL